MCFRLEFWFWLSILSSHFRVHYKAGRRGGGGLSHVCAWGLSQNSFSDPFQILWSIPNNFYSQVEVIHCPTSQLI